MSWQQQSQGGGEQPNGQQGNMGTEYTLQGVMRFLQTEWHRHERERNQWEIERAEMRARIAKLEGENNASKRLQQGYLKRVKMLEYALKQERTKSKPTVNGSQTEDKHKDDKDEAERLPLESHNSILDVSSAPFRTNEAREKSRKYLNDCLKEITYLLMPPNNPPPAPNSILIDPVTGQSIDPAQHKLNNFQRPAPQQHHNSIGGLQQQGISNQPTANSLPHSQSYEQLRQGSQSSQRQEEPSHPQGPRPQTSEDTPNIQNITHSYNSFGEPIPDTDSSSRENPTSQLITNPDPFASAVEEEAWDFDEQSKPSKPESKPTKPPTPPPGRRKSMSRRRSSQEKNIATSSPKPNVNADSQFKVRFALRGHLDVVRAVVFTGGGTPSEPEICTTGDDGVIKRWIVPGGYMSAGGNDIDVQASFTHRGHAGMVTCLASSAAAAISGGLSVEQDSWIFSGGVDATVKIWQNKKVEPKATLVGHTDAIWSVCVLPSTRMDDTITLASGAADGTVKIWSISAPVPSTSGSVRSSSLSSYEQSLPTNDEITYSLLTTITRPTNASPTCITPLSVTGETFVVSYADASIIIYDTHTGEELSSMASLDSYDGTAATGVNAVVATTLGLGDLDAKEGVEEDEIVGGGATGGAKGLVSGVVIGGTEDRFVRFYDANSGQCTYNMLAHPSAISSLALSPDTRELCTAGHDASLRFWSMEMRACTQELTGHRLMRGEGVCAVVWSADGRWVVSGGGDGIVKVYAR